MKKTGGAVEMARLAGTGRGRAVASLLLAFLVVLIVAASAILLRGAAPWWLAVVVSAAAALGLFTLFGATAGLVHFGSMSRQRAFLDGLADAVGDPLVVTDAKGRAVYANGPFIKLASEAGAGRLVGMDVLYAG
ncbi:MAG: hypothetical protein ACREDN_10460, partial [Aestuariivirga sp.]